MSQRLLDTMLRSVSSRIPLRGLPWIFNRVASLIFPEGTTGELRVGDVRFDLDLANPVMRNIYFGIFEKHIIRFMEDVLAPGGTFIDVGANIGYLSAHARRLVGAEGQVHSFEPVPDYHALIVDAVERAGINNVVVNQCAVGEKTGAITIKVSGRKNIGWNTVVTGFMSDSAASYSLSVPITTLSSYVKEKALNRIDLIKIDVEGAEGYVIRGMTDMLSSGLRPMIICEVCPTAEKYTGISVQETFNTLAGFGYRAYTFDRSGFRRFYTGSINLIPVEAAEIKTTTDIVWKPQ